MLFFQTSTIVLFMRRLSFCMTKKKKTIFSTITHHFMLKIVQLYKKMHEESWYQNFQNFKFLKIQKGMKQHFKGGYHFSEKRNSVVMTTIVTAI